jgi:hypothetical protein
MVGKLNDRHSKSPTIARTLTAGVAFGVGALRVSGVTDGARGPGPRTGQIVQTSTQSSQAGQSRPVAEGVGITQACEFSKSHCVSFPLKVREIYTPSTLTALAGLGLFDAKA